MSYYSSRSRSRSRSLPAYSVGGVTPTPIPDFLGSRLVGYYSGKPQDVIIDASRKVSQLTDLSGNGNHLVQPTEARRPRYNMVDRITFVAASQQYLINNSIIADLQSTTIGVYGIFESGTSDVFVVNFNDTDGTTFMGLRNSSTLLWGGTGQNGNTGVATAKNNTAQTFGLQVKKNATPISVMVNNTITETVIDITVDVLSDLPAIDNMAIGARILATPAYLNLFMKQLVLTNGLLTLSELQQLATFINNQNTVYQKVLVAELGQSNMEGRDGDTSNPAYPFSSGKGFVWNGTTESAIVTNRDGAASDRGSHANYFCETFFDLTDKTPVMIECATGGTGLTATASATNWSAGSSLRGAAITKINSALTNYSKALPDVALWCQGETDALTMDANPAYTKAIVKAAMQSVIDWWQAAYPGVPFVISELGFHNNGSPETAGWTNMRAVQNEIVAENTGVYIGFSGAKSFTVGQMYDVFHYNYLGYTAMGNALGTYVAGLLE